MSRKTQPAVNRVLLSQDLEVSHNALPQNLANRQGRDPLAAGNGCLPAKLEDAILTLLEFRGVIGQVLLYLTKCEQFTPP